MALIPKGPYQGMVLVWNIEPVTASISPFGIPALTYLAQFQSYQAYSIIDPADQPAGGIRYRNFLVPIGSVLDSSTLPTLSKNLFCAGHTWTEYGDLVVIGGTDFELDSSGNVTFVGGILNYVFNPKEPCYWPGTNLQYYPVLGTPSIDYVGMWKQAPDLILPRWYATATATQRLDRAPVGTALSQKQRILIAGGSEQVGPQPADRANRTYEALVVVDEASVASSNLVQDEFVGNCYLSTAIAQDKVWDGPNPAGTKFTDWLYEYARLHLLSDGRLFFSGYGTRGAKLNPEVPGAWTQVAAQSGSPPALYSSNWQTWRHDGSSVLFPNLGGNQDIVLRLGGALDHDGLTTDTVESRVGTGTSGWVSAPSMPDLEGMGDGGRVFANVVILPTGALLVLGGLWQDGINIPRPLYSALLFEDGTWVDAGSNGLQSQRAYHSTAVLLPDGRVFLGGGDDRDYDYEIYSPAYLDRPQDRPVNPVWQTPVFLDTSFKVLELQRNVQYQVHFDPLPLGHAITKMVLMAPGSTTHHSDMHQRYVELKADVNNGNEVQFECGYDENVVPNGIYMLFAVTNSSVSHAMWVRFQ